jgi:hypothetical protein
VPWCEGTADAAGFRDAAEWGNTGVLVVRLAGWLSTAADIKIPSSA